MSMQLIRLFVCALALICVGCQHNMVAFTDKEYRQIAWDFLSDDDKSAVTIDWRDARVEVVRMAPPGIIDYSGDLLAWVTFDTLSLLGPIIVLIQADTGEVIGIVPRL